MDDTFARVVVLLNAAPETEVLVVPELRGVKLRLHPFQQLSADPRVRKARFDKGSGSFSVPARTAVVFVAWRAETR